MQMPGAIHTRKTKQPTTVDAVIPSVARRTSWTSVSSNDWYETAFVLPHRTLRCTILGPPPIPCLRVCMCVCGWPCVCVRVCLRCNTNGSESQVPLDATIRRRCKHVPRVPASHKAPSPSLPSASTSSGVRRRGLYERSTSDGQSCFLTLEARSRKAQPYVVPWPIRMAKSDLAYSVAHKSGKRCRSGGVVDMQIFGSNPGGNEPKQD
jgi:hypothetical protein